MPKKNYLNIFLGAASAIGGAYLLNRFLGSETRANPRYTHKKSLEEFADYEKETIITRYVVDKHSAQAIAKDFGATAETIRKILEEYGCEIRDSKTAVVIGRKKELSEDQKEYIRAQWGLPESARPTIKTLCENLGAHYRIVSAFLVEEGLYQRKKFTELTDDDKEKLVAAKSEANRKGLRLNLNRIGEDLGLAHSKVSKDVVLHFFAERGLNRPCDYSGSLAEDVQKRIVSYFSGGGQPMYVEDFAESEGLPVSVVKHVLYINNIIPSAAGTLQKIVLDDSQKDLLVSLLDEGKTNKEIASEMGLGMPTVARLVGELRASQGRTVSRHQESLLGLRDRLKTRDPAIVEFIMSEREKDPPTNYVQIAAKLKAERGVSLSGTTAKQIYIQELGKLL